MADRVGQFPAGRGAEQRGPAQSAQIDPGPGLSARRRGRHGRCERLWRCGRYRASGRRIRGLRTHGHLRLVDRRTGPQGVRGSGMATFPRPCRCLMLPSPPRATDRLSPSVKRITHSSDGIEV
ncbi:hypothetical protein SHJG_6891 [Streptomyces hygroscopicus subsp. jinggangensis 5008]|nr:hypothetical protein SHJG_6891 [Streptomyces hygroscopicus subsp. jinggangensis 5008]AGF66313.1 hypothetical protein SHJGH_6651 [Streptomyces hygroscopicus subsp. jinggangensis TL01]